MRFKCGPSAAEKRARREAKELAYALKHKWHRVFIIWPRRIDDFCYAMQYVERRLRTEQVHEYLYHDYWEYRL